MRTTSYILCVNALYANTLSVYDYVYNFLKKSHIIFITALKKIYIYIYIYIYTYTYIYISIYCITFSTFSDILRDIKVYSNIIEAY